MNILFLITKTYPFGKYEQYITVELNYLSSHFKKIILYPNDFYSNEQTHGITLPENVEVLNFNKTLPSESTNSLSDYLYLLKVTFEEFISTDDKKHFFRHFKWNLVNFWTQYQIAKHLIKYFDKNNYNKNNTVFYSYWFHKSAILLSILKDKKKISGFTSRAHSIELYHHDWGIISDYHKVPPYKMFKLKRTDKLYTVSEHGRLYLTEKYPKYASKYSTLRLGITEYPKKNPIADSKYFHILTCSTIDLNKRIHKLAEALCRIKYPIKWTHFGTGSDSAIKEVTKFTKQFPDNVIFNFKGNVPYIQILEFYSTNKINLFVNLSMVEGLPVSIMEAMSQSIPILATAVYGTPEAVIEKENGFLLPVNFMAHELVDKLNFIIKNRVILAQMGARSHDIYLEKFNAKKNYTEMLNNLVNI